MRATNNGNEMILYLEGRIDSNNAADVESEIARIISKGNNAKVCIDAQRLEYISSAGLRILLKIRKQLDYPIEIRNVSRDVYDIFDTTGFTELFAVKKAYRSLNVDGLEVIGKGFFGTVYRIDEETIVKVYQGADSIPMIENEKKMARKALLSGIPTAISYDIVKVGENYGSVFELLNARTFDELARKGDMPLKDIITEYTGLLKQVHGTELEFGELPSCRERFLDYLDVIAEYISDGQMRGLKHLLDGMPEECTLVHGDIQMKNVMMVAGEPMLIDMDTLGLGNPVFDFAGLYVTYQLFKEDDPKNSMDFLGMTDELVDEIWNGIADTYFDFRDDEERKEITDRIALAAVIRFLYIVVTTDLKNSELGKRRIDHATAHIEELLETVTQLSL